MDDKLATLTATYAMCVWCPLTLLLSTTTIANRLDIYAYLAQCFLTCGTQRVWVRHALANLPTVTKPKIARVANTKFL